MFGQLFADDPGADLFNLTHLEGAQGKGPIGQADQAIDLQAEMFEHPADFAVLALGQGQGDPDIGARGAVLGLVKLGLDGTVTDAFDLDPVLQLIELVLGDAAMGPGTIAADDPGGRLFQGARQTAIIGQEQQALGIEVQSADGDQPRQAFGQGFEHRRTTLGVVVTGHQADGLVIAEQTRRFGIAHHGPIDGEDITGIDLDGRGGQDDAIEGNAAGGNQTFNLPTGGNAGTGKHFSDAVALT